MRELYIPVSDALRNGLSPNERMGVGSAYLRTLLNLRPSPFGLILPSTITRPLTPAPTLDWPFPQLVRGASVTLLAGETTLSLVSETNFSYSSITTKSTGAEASNHAIIAGGVWHFADFGDSWFLFNGACVVMQSRKNRITSTSDPVTVQDDVIFNTGCAHRGRVVAGGMDPAKFWTADQIAFWQGQLSADRPWPPADLTMGENFVIWSGVGGGDWVWDMLRGGVANAPALTAGSYTAANPAIQDRMRALDWGYMPVPWQGTVYQVLPLGDAIMVYGENGIAALTPISDPFPTFGLKHIARFGTAGRGAAAGDDGGHVFVAEDGWLWRVGPDLQIARLGYQDRFDPMLGTDIVVCHDPVDNEFVISNAVLSYTLTQSGLAKTTPSITSMVRMQGGLAVVSGAARTRTIQFETERIDFGFTASKTITGVDVEATGISEIEVSVYWRAENTNGWTQSAWVRANPRGIVMVPVAGTEFRVAVRGTAEAETGTDGGGRVDRLTIHYKSTDRRNLRGAFQAQPGVNIP